ncbi:carboxylesterase/lipase family protein [Microlunatus ginsengisoli]|uniref:Carboxylic ester hydrolase n=1 Tax=Microlunatus ginsengisoli TaxID=363863 RepID=A0ABP7A5J7_9ACTN
MTRVPTVRIEQGELRGVWRGDSAAFLGIPFAEPPVGPNRFGAPVPAVGWQGVRDATTYGPTAQRRPFGEVTAIPEPSIPGAATLNVNVFTPAPGDPAAKLPVFVWIHGGGFKAGSPASPWYDGFAFNRDGIVTVTLSYRLGFDGFGWIADAPDNRGLLDQIAALRWVRGNVGAFGGDPGTVTIGGQSAGGGSVLALLLAPAARGPFRAAISHSGALDDLPLDRARAFGEELAANAGVAPTRSGLGTLSEDQILDLQDEVGLAPPPTSLSALVGGLTGDGNALGGLPFRPYVDGAVLPMGVPDSPDTGSPDTGSPHMGSPAIAAAADVPLIIGSTAHEFTMIGVTFAPLVAGADLRALLRDRLGPRADDYLAAYSGLPGGPEMILGQLITDATFRSKVVRWADARRGPTWTYDFRFAGPTGMALHCADLPFAWDNLGAELVEASDGPNPPQALADAMHGAWVQFITGQVAPWPAWDSGATTMIFDRASAAGPGYVHERRAIVG